MNTYKIILFLTVLFTMRCFSAQVVARKVFYNGSSLVFGNGSGNPINSIDPVVVALLPTQTAGIQNYTNYVKGINGIVVDISGVTGNITAADFSFATWNGMSANGFTSLAAAPLVTQYPGGGVNGSKRIKIVFADNAVKNTWLQVKISVNDKTGLSKVDTFYFGNAVADMHTGNIGDPLTVRVNATDTAAVRQNQSKSGDIILISHIYDVNKDGRVNATDTSAVRQNLNSSIIQMFTAEEEVIPIDECGVAYGDNSTCSDCAGIPYGSSVLDACAVCDGDDSSCSDCNGTPNGGLVVDDCGFCGSGDNSSCSDCEGTIWGSVENDLCGVCGGDNTSCTLITIAGLEVKTPAGISTGLKGRAGDTLFIRGTNLETFSGYVKFNSRMVDNFTYNEATGKLSGEIPTGVEGFNLISVIGQNGIPITFSQAFLDVNSANGGGQIVPGTPNITNCTTHAGEPYPWEGSGACTGNVMIEIPIGSTGHVLIQNSVSPTGDYGFGSSGFRLEVDYRLHKVGSVLQTVRGDGSVVRYHEVSGVWVADSLQLSRNKIKAVGANYVETTLNGSTITYAPIPSQSGAYGAISMLELNNTGVFIERNSLGNILSIKKGRLVNNVPVVVGVGVSISYDSTGTQAEKVEDPDTYEYKLVYSEGKLTELDYPSDGSYTLKWLIEYASTNRITKLVDTETGETVITYTMDGLLEKITSPDTKVVTYAYSSGLVQSRGFMSNLDEHINLKGAVVRSIKEKLESQFTYDDLNQVLTSKDPIGIVTQYSYYNVADFDTLPNYDVRQFLKKITLPNQNTITYECDDSTGKVKRATTIGRKNLTLVTNYTYNSQNKLLESQRGPGNYSKVISYETRNSVTNNNITKIVVNDKEVMSAEYNDDSTLKSVTRKGIETSFGYDAFGNSNSIVSPAGTVSYTNKPSGLRESITAPNYYESTQYDKLGRPTVITKSKSKGQEKFSNSISYGLNSVVSTDSNGNGLDQRFSPNGAYRERIMGTGFIANDWDVGFDANAPKYSNP